MNESSNLNSCVIELHYCLNDGSHSMDAFVLNECEREFLAIVREVARGLGVKVEVRTEALGKGGIMCCFIINSPEFWSSVVDIIQIVCIILQTPGAKVTIDEIIWGVINMLGKSIEKQCLKIDKEIEEIKQDVAKLKHGNTDKTESEPYKRVIDTKKLLQCIDKRIEKRRSNFFANLFLCKAVNELIIRGIDETGAECIPEKRIKRDDFIGFIMHDNEVVPEYVNDAVIEIIPPINIEGRHKWIGVYKDEKISFDMLSNDFKKAVQGGQIRIEDIVSIRCNLEIRRKIDKECGEAVPKGYKVVDVIEFWY